MCAAADGCRCVINTTSQGKSEQHEVSSRKVREGNKAFNAKLRQLISDPKFKGKTRGQIEKDTELRKVGIHGATGPCCSLPQACVRL
jgi:hypothetical protein